MVHAFRVVSTVATKSGNLKVGYVKALKKVISVVGEADEDI